MTVRGTGLLMTFSLCAIAAALPACRRRSDPAHAAAAAQASSAAPASSSGPCVAVLGAAPATCSPQSPCTDLKGTKITTDIDIPAACKSSKRARGDFDDGPPRRFVDAVSSEARAACVFVPKTASAAPMPLVIFVHGSFGNAASVYDSTDLRAKAASKGFVLASPQGRNLHWPDGKHFDGSHEDVYHSDVASPSSNADVRSLDRLVDDLVNEGHVDAHRIYVMGWSNGATFANLYAVGRHETPTPGGHKVAAAAVYAGASPFRGGRTCLRSTVPLLEVHRDCDALVACDDAQGAQLKLPAGSDVRGFIAAARGTLGDGKVDEVLLDADGREVGACATSDHCGELRGLANHMRWPAEHEDAMLTFLEQNPLR